MRLDTRHYNFIEYYANPKLIDTVGNATKAYEKAFNNIKTAKSCASSLMAKSDFNKLVMDKIAEYGQKEGRQQDFDENMIRAEWLELIADCKENGDRTNLNSALRSMAQHKSMLTDKYQVDSKTEAKSIPDNILDLFQEFAIERTKPNIKLKTGT